MLKRILSCIVAVSFLVNSVSSGYALAPESRLKPVENPELLDIMKLTAEAARLGLQGEIGIRERASLTNLSTSQSSPKKEWWPNIKPLQYEGPGGSSKLAFQWYDPKGNIDGRSMKDVFRFSMAWWHAMRGEGGDIFGGPSKTLPWLANPDPMQRARDTVDAAFELMQKLGIPFYAFHDRDVAPEATKPDGTIDVVQSEKNLREIAAYLKQKQDETGIKLLWGTANLFSNRRFMNGAATNPDLAVLLHSAAQVKAVLEVTNELGGANYVLWGGREGYYSLINTATDKELDNLAQFLRMVRDHARKIGFKGKLMIEPKAKEPTGHQYDYDAATVMGFLRKYGLEKDFYLNIEPNHASLAGHTGGHDLQVAADNGTFSGLDANSGVMPGAPQLGWDTDHFPGLQDALEAMLVIDKIGGFTSGGVHFDAKTHRTSTDPEDLFIAHALGMDSYVLAHIIARSYLADPEVQEFLRERYASYDTELGKRFKEGNITLEEAAKLAAEIGEPVQKSGKLEFLQRKLQQHMIMAPVEYFISQRNARSEYTHEKIDEVTEKTAPKELVRPGDEIVFDFRHKVIVSGSVFIPCWIKGMKHGDTVVTTRHYLCYATPGAENKFNYEFVPDKSADLKGLSIADAVKDRELLYALSYKSRPADVKAGVARYAAQQEIDRYIAGVLTGKIEGVWSSLTMNIGFVREIYDVLNANGFKVAGSFMRLVDLGQVIVIRDLKAPHAGGMGIYLTDQNPETLVHEIFAKCGLGDDEAEKMIGIFNKLKNRQGLDASESALFEKAKALDFANRWDDMLNIDYNRLTIQEMPQELIARYRGSGKNWYLGIDSSTQSVKFNVIDGDTGETIWQWAEVFSESQYAKYGAPSGWLLEPLKSDPDAYYTDPRMTTEALDRGMRAIAISFAQYGWSIKNIRRISGAGQQHGLVFLNEHAEGTFAFLNLNEPISDQVGGALAWDKATIWKNKVTGKQQADVNALFGGADRTRQMTGSSAELRFGALQAAWLRANHPDVYAATHRIINIAGFNAALLTGAFAFDEGDAAGSNMMDIRTGQWLAQIDQLVPGLTGKLAPICPTNQVVGRISAYWADKYGFSRETQVVNFTGDNPSAMTGQGIVRPGQAAISLGTSFTAYSYVDEAGLDAALASPIGNVFKEPDGKWMKLVCFQNGADALKRIRDDKIGDQEAIARLAQAGKARQAFATEDEWKKAIDDMKWVIFNELVSATPAGNDGAMMITQVEDETVMPIRYIAGMPWTRNLDYYNDDRGKVLRAAAEGQIRFLKYVADKAGLKFTEINLTGGAAKNPVIRQMVAGIFNAKVNVLQRAGHFPTEAVALGGAIRAAVTDMKDRGVSINAQNAAKKYAKAEEGVATPENADKYSDEQKRAFEDLVDTAVRQSADKEAVEKLAREGRIAAAIDFHKKSFGVEPQSVAEGPGRVNLFGEHSDYAGGQVMPIALDGVSVIAAASSRTDGKIVIVSPRFGRYETTVEALKKISADAKAGLAAIPEEYGWARYPLGVMRQLLEVPGITVTGLNISYDGNVPLGGGLSSSAAVETSVFTASNAILKTNLDIKGAARLCQKAEHWRGNMCGIMDQYASLAGKKGNAILLNCNTLESKPVDISFLDVAGYAIVAVDTGLPKTDEAWKKYMARRGALETAVEEFFKKRPELGVNTILDIAPKVTPEVFGRIRADLLAATNEEVVRRMSHVVSEEARVLRATGVAAAANAIAAKVCAGDESARPKLEAKVREFAAILNEVHESLDKVYEMSSPYLNKLVESAMSHDSVGSRLTGAGIVGATVNIVKKNDIGRFSEGVVAGYRAAFPDQPVPTVTVSRAGDGAGVLDIGRTRESKHAESAADRLKALLNGPFGHAQLEVIDATVDELLEKEQAEALKILREGDGKTANCILERLALPEVQEKIKADYLALLLTAAELNNAFGVAPRGRAITGNLAQRFIGNSSRIAMPENTTSIVSARKITQARVCQITAPSAIEDIRQYGSPVNAAKPQRTSFLEKHTTATQYFLVTEGELVMLAAPDGDANSAKAYRVKKGEAIMVGKGIWHMSVTTSPDTKFIVYNQEEGRKENNPTPPTAFICIGSVYEIGASEAALPEGIDETVIDLAAAESRSQRTVVFVSQDFAASAERCRELLPDFSNVEYVPFNQHTQLPELASIVGDTQYDGCRKVLITNAVNREEMATLKNIVAANSEIFRNVIPINTGAEGFSSVAEQKSFQKGVLGMALLAAAIPQDPQAYKGSRSYVVLKSLLKMILGTEKDADDYITNMVNPSGSIDVTMRFGYLIGRIIGPVKKLVVNGFTRIVNIFA